MNLEKTIELLERLSASLSSANLDESADYFLARKAEINATTSADDISEVLQIIHSSGPMSQYVGFNKEQDQIHVQLIEEVETQLQ